MKQGTSPRRDLHLWNSALLVAICLISTTPIARLPINSNLLTEGTRAQLTHEPEEIKEGTLPWIDICLWNNVYGKTPFTPIPLPPHGFKLVHGGK